MVKLSFGLRTLCFSLTFFVVSLCAENVREILAQTDPTIQHTAIECLPNNQHAICSAVITPSADIQTARVYFRSDRYPDFYYVEMTGEEDDFEAVLPIPSDETSEVIYYVEAVNRTFNMGRSEENNVPVTSESECRRRDEAALWWTGGEPGIVVGATVEGASAIPPGFQAAGIAGFISAAGAASSLGGGIGAGTAVGIGAGVAAGVTGIAVATGGSEETTTTTVTGGGGSSTTTTTTATATTTSVTSGNEPPVACFTLDPANGEITAGDNIRLDARCSEGDQGGGDAISNYEWDLGDGRTRSGPDQAFITPRYNTPGVYTITLTVTDSGGASSQVLFGLAQSGEPLSDSESKEITVSAPIVVACFTASATVPCIIDLNATCSGPDISRYDWVIDTGGVLSGPITRSGRRVSYTFPFCFNTTIEVRLSVTGDAGQRDSITQQVPVRQYVTSRALDNNQISTSFSSFLSVPPFDGRANGHIVLNNARTFSSNNSRPVTHGSQGRVGVNEVEAYLPTPVGVAGSWRFDFGSADGFVSGSIKVQSGQVIAIDSRSIVFRLSGTPGERIKFTFQLLP
jgi:PKD repeat protein